MWPCCGTAVFALAGWHFPTRCHTRLARVQLLSRIGPFDCARWCHVFMLPCCHLDTSRRTTRGGGQEEEKTEDKKMTTGGQGLETGWQPRPSWRQQENNRRTKRGQESRGQTVHHKKDKRKDNARTSPARPETVASFYFPKREPQPVHCLGKKGSSLNGLVWVAQACFVVSHCMVGTCATG